MMFVAQMQIVVGLVTTVVKASRLVVNSARVNRA